MSAQPEIVVLRIAADLLVGAIADLDAVADLVGDRHTVEVGSWTEEGIVPGRKELEVAAVHRVLEDRGVVGRRAAVVGNLEEVAGIDLAGPGKGTAVGLGDLDMDTAGSAEVQAGLVEDSRKVVVEVVQVEAGSNPGQVAAVLDSLAVEAAHRLVANREVVVKSS